MRVQNLSWKAHPPKFHIYGEIPPISAIVAQRRAHFTGHYFRSQKPDHLQYHFMGITMPKQRNRPLTYPDTITRDTGLTFDELGCEMMDKTQWQSNDDDGDDDDVKRKHWFHMHGAHSGLS